MQKGDEAFLETIGCLTNIAFARSMHGSNDGFTSKYADYVRELKKFPADIGIGCKFEELGVTGVHILAAKQNWNILYWALVLTGQNLDFVKALCERDDIDFNLRLGSQGRTVLQFAEQENMIECKKYITAAMERQAQRATYRTTPPLSTIPEALKVQDEAKPLQL